MKTVQQIVFVYFMFHVYKSFKKACRNCKALKYLFCHSKNITKAVSLLL